MFRLVPGIGFLAWYTVAPVLGSVRAPLPAFAASGVSVDLPFFQRSRAATTDSDCSIASAASCAVLAADSSEAFGASLPGIAASCARLVIDANYSCRSPSPG